MYLYSICTQFARSDAPKFCDPSIYAQIKEGITVFNSSSLIVRNPKKIAEWHLSTDGSTLHITLESETQLSVPAKSLRVLTMYLLRSATFACLLAGKQLFKMTSQLIVPNSAPYKNPKTENTANDGTIRIAEWNLNNATKDVVIPDFVVEEIRNIDIVIFTEFVKEGGSKRFLDSLIKEGFKYSCSTHRNGRNTVLLAWKAGKFELLNSYEIDSTSGTFPDFLMVQLKGKESEREFYVVGARIIISSKDKERVKQMNKIFSAIDKQASGSTPVIIAGDFNNYRRGLPAVEPAREWSIAVLNTLAYNHGYVKYTPEGGSIFQAEARKDYQFPEDHFISKGMVVGECHYDRSFTLRHKEVYIGGENFQIYNSSLRRNTWQIICGSGVPDHALLTGTFSFNGGGRYEPVDCHTSNR